ncbi:winged helix-turn-helix domain-containing protein [Halorarius litoreus]|uniref:winged helix-turn-helix domain-containing protein n=1 Tax=Halorarius litoreus TaxID=2962676 RepID=UPI0020CE3E89|nr:winged helix-turn-helix domain-containing protein [Halorarius litoreus]
MTDAWDPETVFDLFGSESARHILALASETPMTADDLASHLSISQPTVYRRVGELLEYDLLTERDHIDDEGNHYNTYVSNLDAVTFRVEDGSFVVDLQLERDVAEQVRESDR